MFFVVRAFGFYYIIIIYIHLEKISWFKSVLCLFYFRTIAEQKLFRFSNFWEKRVSSYNNRCAYICILVENTTHKICIYTFFLLKVCFHFFIAITANTGNIGNVFFWRTTNEIFVFPRPLNNKLSHRVPI